MPETKTMTLTDFLLARIAEEESWVREGTVRGLAGERLTRECGAKRRIIETHGSGHECPGIGPIWTSDDVSDQEWTRPCDTLLILAAVYADHPDYHDEWAV